jgi:uncharacterized repeat protein (TIGR03803 family)
MKTFSTAHYSRTFVLALSFSLLSAFAARADALFSLLHTFGPPAPDGAHPFSTLVEGTDGNFYGTAVSGGQFGAGNIFQVTPSGILTLIYTFTNGSDGAYPRASLIVGSDGDFYGTAAYGGTNGAGTVFKVSTNGSFTALYSFRTNQIDGQRPEAALVEDSDGNFLGTTPMGGTGGGGTIFKVTPTGVLTNLHNFTGSGTDGSGPTAPLILGSDGNFYGTTASGGNHLSGGTVFKITPQGVWTNLHSFTNYTTDGSSPQAALVLGTDENFYGTTYGGGTFGYGTVFMITSNGTLTVLYSFSNGHDGGQPYAALVQGDNGDFYGTTEGASNLFPSTNSIGTIFEITPGGHLTTLYSFTNGLDGANPIASLVLGTDGDFYGAAESGGIIGWGGSIESFGRILSGNQGWGTIFSISQSGQFTPLFAFGDGSEGQNPGAGLIQATNGRFYGVTERGGTNYDGTVFQMSQDGAVTPLYSFTAGTEGAVPIAALAQGNDGNFYGTTYEGGISNAGAIFMITPAGVLTTLHTFTNGLDGGNAMAPLVQGTNGNFYGTASSGGGKNGYGTVFQITSGGAFSTLHVFTNSSSGKGGTYPTSGLVQGADGQFYGTTYSGGTNGYGTIFKIAADGTFISLYSFNGTNDGAGPTGTLALGSDGNFYGVCDDGSIANGNGTVFKVTSSGALTPLYSLNGTNDGYYPEAPLIAGTDGKFYGTTEYGGENSVGTVFQITTNGDFTTLHSFTPLENGPESYAALVQATNGNFYVACEGSGYSFNPGTIFRLTVPPVMQSMAWAGNAWNISWNGQTGQRYQLQWSTNLNFNGWLNLGSPLSGQGPTINGMDGSPAEPQRFYRVMAVP